MCCYSSFRFHINIVTNRSFSSKNQKRASPSFLPICAMIAGIITPSSTLYKLSLLPLPLPHAFICHSFSNFHMVPFLCLICCSFRNPSSSSPSSALPLSCLFCCSSSSEITCLLNLHKIMHFRPYSILPYSL
jgi:hypothetical protein